MELWRESWGYIVLGGGFLGAAIIAIRNTYTAERDRQALKQSSLEREKLVLEIARQPRTGGPLKLITALLDMAGRNGWLWPTNSTIEQRAGMRDQARTRAVKWLVQRGYLLVQRRWTKSGDPNSNGYTFPCLVDPARAWDLRDPSR